MKKIGILTSAALISGLALSNHAGLAISKPISIFSLAKEESAQQVDTTNFIKFSGVIKEIEKDSKTTRFIVENPENSLIMIFPVNDDVLLFDSGKGEKLKAASIEKGAKVEAYYDKNKPMTMIYPATIAPEIMIVNGHELGSAKISKFDKNLVSLDNELKLHISEDTILLNENGDSLKEDELVRKELIVFYTIATKSIPAQTTPTKIIALDFTDESLQEINQMIEDDYYFKNDTKMIPIRKVAEKLGYVVDRNAKQNTVLLRKQVSSILLYVGKKEYGYNRSLGYFEEAPEIKDGKTYVSEELLEKLLNN